MTKPMDKQAEQRVIDAVKLVSAHVEGGEPPTAAVVKAATALKLGREMIPMVVNAYNVGRTTYQREHGGDSILDKQASFPIAHLETILGELYPPDPKTDLQLKRAHAVDPAYQGAPAQPPKSAGTAMEKVADIRLPAAQRAPERSAGYSNPPSLSQQVKRAFGERDRIARDLDQVGHQYRNARDKYLAAMGALTNYFKEASLFRLPFAEVEWNAEQLFGEPARHALQYAYTNSGLSEKRASGPPSLLRAVDRTQAPYTLIKAAIDRGRELLAASRAYQAAQREAPKRVEATFRPFALESPRGDPDPFPTRCSILGPSRNSRAKEANFLSNMIAMGVGTKLRSLGNPPKTPADMVDDVTKELNDPEHMSELRDIETRAMLADMLHNDEVISGYDPDDVFNAYNEISQLSPTTANQPAVIRPLLRKRLTQGAMEPFEAQQIADIEKTVGQSQHGTISDSGMKLSKVLRGSDLL